VKIIEKKEMKFIGIKINTNVQECGKEAPKLWDNFMKKYIDLEDKSNIINPNTMYGLCFEQDKKTCNFDYYACVEVADFNNIPNGFESKTVEKSRYASFTHKGKIHKIGETYNKVQQEMGQSNLKQKELWIEVYDERYKDGNDDSEVDILVEIE
jgi:AraC family transcriptional regulator